MNPVRTALLIAGKDLLGEIRARERVPAMLLFAALVLLVMHFAVGLDSAAGEPLAPGVLQVALLFAGTLGLYRSFASETASMALHGLMLAPTDRAAIYLGKVISGTALLALVQLPIVVLYSTLFGVNLAGAGGVTGYVNLTFLLLCGAFGFMALGVTVAAVSAATPAREVLLPLLLFPLAAPLLIAGVSGLRAISLGEPVADATRFVALATLAFLAVSWMVFEFALEE